MATVDQREVAQRYGKAVGAAMGLAGLSLGLVAGGAVGPERWRAQIVAAIALGAFALSEAAAIKLRSASVALMGVSFLFVAVGDSLQHAGAAPGVMALVAVGAIASLGGGLLVGVRGARLPRELERFLFSESTSVAFIATMLAALAYGFFEAWIDLPRASAWFVWGFGMTSWLIASAVFSRKYS